MSKIICGSCSAEVNDTQKFCQDCGAGLQPIDDKRVQVAIAFAKDMIEKVKAAIKKADPKAKFSTFNPVSKAQKGYIVKTTAPEKLKEIIKDLKLRVVSGGKLGASNSPAFASEEIKLK